MGNKRTLRETHIMIVFELLRYQKAKTHEETEHEKIKQHYQKRVF